MGGRQDAQVENPTTQFLGCCHDVGKENQLISQAAGMIRQDQIRPHVSF
jgi:hypothetical protein